MDTAVMNAGGPLRKLVRYWLLARARAGDGNLSTLRQVVEMVTLAVLTGNGPGFYQMAGFWRQSVPWCDKVAHLNAGAYRRRLRLLNPPDYRKITQNKLPEKGLLSLFEIPTPAFVGFLHPSVGRTARGERLRDGADLARLLESVDTEKLCFKPAEGWGGKGVEIVEVLRGKPAAVRRLRTGKRVGAVEFGSELLARNASSGVVIEHFLEQHPDMAHFNPSSVNTCRVWVARARDGQARVALAYLRIGRGGSVVDNQSSGGIVAPIDLASGTTGPAIDGLSTRTEYIEHPDHGARIAGRQVPHWQEIQALATECLGIIPRLRFAGLDIAVGMTGPVVLELNASPDREGAAFVGIPSADALPSD
jgi:hypothetical protein